MYNCYLSQLPSVASKRGHETKKVPNVTCFAAKHLTAVKENRRFKGKLFICFWSARSAHVSFLSMTFRHVLSLRNITLVSRKYSERLKIVAKNIRSTACPLYRVKTAGKLSLLYQESVRNSLTATVLNSRGHFQSNPKRFCQGDLDFVSNSERIAPAIAWCPQGESWL